MLEDGFRNPVELIHKTVQQIRYIDSSFIQKSTEGMQLYRGTKTLRPTPYLGKNTGYISTSKSTHYFSTRDGERFISLKNKCCLYIYELAEGIPYIDLQSISHFPEQEEVLLPRGLTATLLAETKTTIGKKPVKTYRVRLEGPPDTEPYTLHESLVDTANTEFFKNVQLEQINRLYEKYSNKTDILIESMSETYGSEVEYIVSDDSYRQMCMRFLKDVQTLLNTTPLLSIYDSQINEMLERGEVITPANYLQIE